MEEQEHLKGKVVPLAGLVSYQTNAIVSRTLLRTPAGHIVLFAFDKGQELSEHTSPYEVMVLVLEGETEFTVGGQRVRMGAGDALFLTPHTPHALKALTPLKLLLTLIRSEVAEQ